MSSRGPTRSDLESARNAMVAMLIAMAVAVALFARLLK